MESLSRSYQNQIATIYTVLTIFEVYLMRRFRNDLAVEHFRVIVRFMLAGYGSRWQPMSLRTHNEVAKPAPLKMPPGIVAKHDQWNISTVRQRQAELAAVASKTWPLTFTD
jgi:hypothetical protein